MGHGEAPPTSVYTIQTTSGLLMVPRFKQIGVTLLVLPPTQRWAHFLPSCMPPEGHRRRHLGHAGVCRPETTQGGEQRGVGTARFLSVRVATSQRTTFLLILPISAETATTARGARVFINLKVADRRARAHPVRHRH